MVEQNLQPLLEQRQPMVDAGQAAPLGNRLVDRIAGRGGTESFAVARAEALDAVFVEQGLGSGEEGEAASLVAGRALRAGIEAANALDLVAEEIEAQAFALAGREEIDDAAAHRELAGVG